VRREGEALIVPRIFRWFPGDFGGPSGIRRFLAVHGHPTDGLRLRYAPWDWTPAPDAWRIESSVSPSPPAAPPEASL
jgi:hypothetical protein